MQLINGKDTLKQIINKLLVKYVDAPREQVTDDVIVMLQSLADKGFLKNE